VTDKEVPIHFISADLLKKIPMIIDRSFDWTLFFGTECRLPNRFIQHGFDWIRKQLKGTEELFSK